MDNKYYKFLPSNLTCKGFKYQLGLNIDINEFNNSIRSYANGLHFAKSKYIGEWIWMYHDMDLKIAEIEIPKGEEVVKCDELRICKAHSIIIKSIRDLWTVDTFKWMIENNIDIHYGNEVYLQTAIQYEKYDVAKFIIQDSSNPYRILTYALPRAIISNKKEDIDIIFDNIMKARVIYESKYDIILNAIRYRNIYAIKRILESGFIIDKEIEKRIYLWSINLNKFEVLKYLSDNKLMSPLNPITYNYYIVYIIEHFKSNELLKVFYNMNSEAFNKDYNLYLLAAYEKINDESIDTILELVGKTRDDIKNDNAFQMYLESINNK